MARDLIAPLWTDLNNAAAGTIYYQEVTSGPLLERATADINTLFPTLSFSASSVFTATWDGVPDFARNGAGYTRVEEGRYFSIPVAESEDLPSSSNININGRWVFRVDGGSGDLCAELNCTEDEWCGEKNGIYGCYCDEIYDETDSESFDAVLSCHSSSGTISLSRCQLLEAGFPAHVLHMNDPNCTGTIRDGRVIFQFDNNMRICGTTLTTVSMREDIIPLERNVNVELPAGQGTYQVQMIPYPDPKFSQPFNGSVDEIVDEQLYVAVHVDGVDSSHVAMVMDTCWATPVSDPAYNISWDLIVNGCPNPEDGTVEVLENGNSTTGLFSFRIFTFVGNFSQVFLHCKTHICLLKDNSCTLPCDQSYHMRRRRSVDGHDSASVSLGPLEFSDRNTDAVDVQFPTAVRIHRAP
ncbi:uromodulin-like [Chanos chanos]|uniref:Uromodulin-like n=1 Tax=Chanos chanos TaxID=29144 RepID=A0A6J2VFI6_CHACN|nr:uromodulin-like [Chanos chanos]